MEIPVKGKSIVDATLHSENAVLNDVVVVGYTSKQRSHISSSVSIVSGAFWVGHTSQCQGISCLFSFP